MPTRSCESKLGCSSAASFDSLSAGAYIACVRISLNGEARELPEGTTVAGLLAMLALAPGRVAVEQNRTIVARAEHAQVVLRDGDQLEIVTFVGGG
jgi:sulfur carrier protein